jgi:hypothetical protein
VIETPPCITCDGYSSSICPFQIIIHDEGGRHFLCLQLS